MKTRITHKDVDNLEKKLEGLDSDKSKDVLKLEGVLDRDGKLTWYGENILGMMAGKSTNHGT